MSMGYIQAHFFEGADMGKAPPKLALPALLPMVPCAM